MISNAQETLAALNAPWWDHSWWELLAFGAIAVLFGFILGVSIWSGLHRRDEEQSDDESEPEMRLWGIPIRRDSNYEIPDINPGTGSPMGPGGVDRSGYARGQSIFDDF